MLVGLLKGLWNRVRVKRDPAAFFRSQGAQVGERCRFISPQQGTLGGEPWLVSLGNHVTVTSEVRFITHDGGVWVFRDEHPEVELYGRITVGDNVFLGLGCTLMPGVTIGDNAIVAARAVVTRDVPAGTIVGGIPAVPLGTIEAYWEKRSADFTFVRSLPPDEKRRRVLEHLSGTKR